MRIRIYNRWVEIDKEEAIEHIESLKERFNADNAIRVLTSFYLRIECSLCVKYHDCKKCPLKGLCGELVDNIAPDIIGCVSFTPYYLRWNYLNNEEACFKLSHFCRYLDKLLKRVKNAV